MSSLSALFLITHLNTLVTKCSVYDTPCLTSMSQIYTTSVIPGGTGYGIESLDPMMLDTIAGQINEFSYELNGIEIGGMKHTLVDKVQFNKDQKQLYVKYRIPNLNIFSNYTTNGSQKGIPFKGEGRAFLELFDLEFDMIMNYEIIKSKEDKEHILVDSKGFTYFFDLKYAKMVMENMNADDPVSASKAQEYFKYEYKSAWQENGRRIFDRVCGNMVQVIRKFLLIIPAESMFLDYN